MGDISDVTKSDIWINGGYFVLRTDFVDQIRPGEDMVEEPFRRLAARGELLAHRHEGFWAPMDTLKDKQCLETLHESGEAPWQVWDAEPAAARSAGATPSPDDAAAVDRPAGSRAEARAGDRRASRRHRDRMRWNAPQADRAGRALGGLLGRPERQNADAPTRRA